MSLQVTIKRSLISKKSIGVFFAVLALFVQPIVSLNIPAVFAATITDKVVINEVMANPVVGQKEWVELYNPTSSVVSLNSWTVTYNDGAVSYPIPAQDIAPGGFALIEAPDSTSYLNNAGDTIRLLDSANDIINSVTYGNSDVNVSYARKYDASINFIDQVAPTKGSSNGVEPIDYSNVYVSPTGVDINNGTSAATPFNTIQKALDTVAENGTVHVADGSYTGTAQFKKSGTKLIGTSGSRDTAQINVLTSSGQAGLYAEGLNNITIKNIAVFGTQGSAGALVKLSNGDNAVIENVVVKSQDVVTSGAARTNASGININTFSNVRIDNSFIAGVAKDGISVVAQQNTTLNSSKNITIQNTSVAGAGWSAIAFYTATGNQKSIENVTISNVTTQYGQRGIYIDGAGGTVTSSGTDSLVLNNVTVGQNTNEYINNEQVAGVDARTLKVNVGNGVVVPVAAMTQSQYDTVITFIKDKNHKNPTAANYGVVQLINQSAPVVSLKANGTNITNGGATNKVDIVASWTKPVGEGQSYEYAYWNNIEGNSYNTEEKAWKTSVSGLERPGSFTEGEGTHYIKVRALDVAGNYSAWSTPFVVRYDKTAPIISDLSLPALTNSSTIELKGTVFDTNLKDYNVRVYNEAKTAQVNPNIVYTGTSNVSNDILANLDISALPSGTYSVRIWADDVAGNRAGINSHIYRSFKIDRSVPTGSIVQESLDNGKTVRLTLTTTEPVQTITGWDRVSGTDNQFTREGITSNGLVSVAFTDLANNPGEASINVTAIDDVAPSAPTALATVANGVVTVSGLAETGATVKVTIGGVTYNVLVSQQGTWSIVTNTLPAGSYAGTATVVDLAGNVSNIRNFSVTVAPAVAPILPVIEATGSNNQIPLLATITASNQVSTNTTNNGQNSNIVQTNPSSALDDGEVLGTQDSNKSTDKVAAITPSEEGWKIFGFTWYWWLLILAAIAGIWWAIAGYRRRNNEEV